jgi:hypothetical protein
MINRLFRSTWLQRLAVLQPLARRSGLSLAAALLLLAFGGGCWEVIPYEPDESRPPTAPVNGGRNIEEIGASDETSSSPPVNRQPEDAASGSGPRSNLEQPDRVVSVAGPEKVADDGADGDRDAGDKASTDDPPEESTTDPQSRLLTWNLGSCWGLGTAYFAKDVAPERYRPILDEATVTAHLLGVEVPPLPDLTASDSKISAVVAYLVKDQGHELAQRLGRQLDQAHAGLFELATGSYVLLLIYSPRHQGIQSHLDQVEQSARLSGLPQSIWGPLVELLRKRAPYQQVKEAVFRLHEQTDAHLARS